MSSTTTPFKPLGELYLHALIEDAQHGGAAGTIVSAITSWHEVLDVIQPDQQNTRRSHQLNAACTLTRHAMGLLEVGFGLISRESLHETTDWARIDHYFDELHSPAEDAWVHAQLTQQSARCWELYRDYANPEGSQNHGGIHWEWIHQIEQAATFLQAAALLLADAFGIEEVEA